MRRLSKFKLYSHVIYRSKAKNELILKSESTNHSRLALFYIEMKYNLFNKKMYYELLQTGDIEVMNM